MAQVDGRHGVVVDDGQNSIHLRKNKHGRIVLSGSFTWDAIVRIGTIKPYERALVLTVYHELDNHASDARAPIRPAWNTIVCFKDKLRSELIDHLGPGDLAHFHGYVRTTTFTDDADAKRRAVDLVILRFDLLDKHIDGPTDHRSSAAISNAPESG